MLTSKLKAIRIKYLQAVDSGRRSGHGRVVMIYFELFESIWGGSPPTEQLSNGFESTELESDPVALSDTGTSGTLTMSMMM